MNPHTPPPPDHDTTPPGAAPTGPRSAAAPDAPRRRRRGLGWGLGGLLLVLVCIVALGVGAHWAATTTAGSRWLLARLALVGVKVQADDVQGTLLGSFKARQVRVTVGRTEVTVLQPEWQGLRLGYSTVPGVWGTVHIDRLSADHVRITSGPGDGGPLTLPHQLRLPVVLKIDQVQAGELIVPGLAEHPFREVSGQVHLGADRGRQHRFEQLSARLDPLVITGHARIGADGTMPLDVALQAVQSPQSDTALPTLPAWAKALRTDWQAQATARGPLAGFDLQAALRAQGQSLDAMARVAPEAAWPLPQLEATTEGLDLSALVQHAPLTAISGSLRIAPTAAEGGHTLALHADLRNTQAGRWDLQHLPLRALAAIAEWRTDRTDELSLTHFDATLADERRDAGVLQGTARWKAGEFAIDAQLAKVLPSALDAHLAAMTLSGPVTLSGKLQPRAADGSIAPPRFNALADLKGQLVSPAKPVSFRLDATGSEARIELRELRAMAGDTRADLSGLAERRERHWDVNAKAALVDFDPQPWFPSGPSGGWHGNHRFNLHGDTHLTVADSVWAQGASDQRSAIERLAGLGGNAAMHLDNSLIAGVPVSGDLRWQQGGDRLMKADAQLDAGGNRVSVEGQVASSDARGNQDRWTLDAQAPTLARLAPLLRLLAPEGSSAAALVDNLSGSLTANAQATGRWPDLRTEGQAQLNSVRAGDWAVGQGQARWQATTDLDAPLQVQVDVTQAAWSQRQIGSTTLTLQGSGRQHQLSLRSEVKAAPPLWMDNLQGGRPAPAPAATPQRTLVSLNARGSLSGNLLASADPRDSSGTSPPWTWKGQLQQAEVRTTQPGAAPLLLTRDIAVDVRGGSALRVNVAAGRADILGAGLKWNSLDWEAGRGLASQQLDLQAELEPFAIAPFLRRAQPNFGWGGDLQVAGKVIVKQTDTFTADIVLERVRGDLTVTEESGTNSLGLTDMRIGMVAQDGVWSFSAGLAGAQLGVLGGALVVRTSPQAAWPAADAPVQGVLEAQVANLGTWGPWLPAGWRVDGRLNVSASLGGRFNAPEYTGKVIGSGIGVRNMLEGINVTDGQVDISLDGATARINTFSARGGNGTVRLEGDARLDDVWRARVRLVADKFQLLGRVDLRTVVTGEARITLEDDNVKGDGRFVVDEGLIDFTRLSSPSLGDDVVVTGRGNDPNDTATAPAASNTHRFSLDLLVNLGDHLRMRGLGIDTELRGALRVSRPGGKWALAGTVNAVNGTFANYGQKLAIDRGIITFNGAPSDMRLDIEATRPNLDVRVGVAVTGPLQNLRIKLFSEPDMTNNEKLSWLLLGRASDGLGKTDTALVQRAAFALLAGDGDGGPGAITKAFGIDDLGLRQSDGDSRETLVSVGKQLSKRVYVAYEQNLTTSTGSFQVTYRIAQRFVMRLQSGLDRSIDFIGTWRWE